jgi:acetyl-CoA decarbonylase/synthase, CODH/ACS complex subunit gamma
MEIFKTLPKTNCKQCNSASCLAFAMKVAAGKADFMECPVLSEESVVKLQEMLEPPMKEIILTRGDKKIVLGGEKVMFRHDESFYNPTALAVEISTDLSEDQVKEKIENIETLKFERVGECLSIDMIAVQEKENYTDFAGFAAMIYEKTALHLLVKTDNIETIRQILNWRSHDGLILSTNINKVSELIDKIKNRDISLSLTASDKEESCKIGEFYKQAGIKKGIIEAAGEKPAEILNLLHTIRLEALAYNNRNLSYPTLYWPDNNNLQLMLAASAVMKYGSITVISYDEMDSIQALLTLRQNIFTDPRRPIQVEAKLYSFGDVTHASPVMVTTNFSLTYFTVAQEIESSGIPAYLLVVDTDGTSVLTAWSADKFTEKTIVKAMNSENLYDIVDHHEIIIPGYVSMLKEDIEYESGWKVITGPAEASGIPEFLRNLPVKMIGYFFRNIS